MNQDDTRMNILDLGSPLRMAPEMGEDKEQEAQFSIAELASTFSVFNRVSAELDKSYQSLEQQVSELNIELAQTREQRVRDVAEKEHQIERLNALVSVLPSGVVVLDKNSIVCDINPKATELLGEPLLGLSWSGVVSRIAVPEVRAGFELKLRDGRILSLMSRELAATGERVILITEVTSIHENQERVSRDERLAALGEMAASLAHQIRTPLSSAMLYMSQLSLSRLPEEARTPMANKVQERLSHMSSLIDSMLSFVRGAKPDTKAISLASLMDKTEHLVRVPANQANAGIKFVEVDPSLMIHGDIEALAGAITNLVLNAIENNSGSPWVCVQAQVINQSDIEIKVTDNGPGIAEQHMDKVFDPFFTTRMQGTGLGLAVVAMTVAAHEGQISVCNRDTGGAEFTIRLPAINTLSAIGTPVFGNDLLSREVA